MNVEKFFMAIAEPIGTIIKSQVKLHLGNDISVYVDKDFSSDSGMVAFINLITLDVLSGLLGRVVYEFGLQIRISMGEVAPKNHKLIMLGSVLAFYLRKISVSLGGKDKMLHGMRIESKVENHTLLVYVKYAVRGRIVEDFDKMRTFTLDSKIGGM